MTRAAPSLLPRLAMEAVVDAVRRRIVPVIVAVCLFSLLVIDSCTACASIPLSVNGESIEIPTAAGVNGMVMFVMLSLWSIVLAGILASDHLAHPISDGSATLILARPVGRSAYALSRLIGALAISLTTGAVLLAATAWLLHLRAGVALVPAVWGFGAFAVGALIVSSLAATVSLVLPQIATVLLVLIAVGFTAGVNLLVPLNVGLGGVALAVHRHGPPLATAIVAALEPWLDSSLSGTVGGDAVDLGLRLVVWAAAGVALLIFAFRRVELGR